MLIRSIILVAVAGILFSCAYAETTWQEGARQAFLSGEFLKVRPMVEPFAQAGDDIPQGLAAVYLAGTLTMQGNFDGAKEWHDRAEAIFKSQKSDDLVGRLLVARAVASFLESRKYSSGAPEEALDYLEKAKPLLGEDDLWLQMVGAEMMGRSSKAVHVQNSYLTYMKLIARFESAGDSLNMAHCCVKLAGIDGATGGHQSALSAYLRGARIFDEAGEKTLAALYWRNAGHASRKVRDYDGAERLLKKALGVAQATGNLALTARVRNDLSRCYSEMERYGDAEKQDQMANEALEAVAAAIDKGEIEDSVALDFYQLYKGRYASLLLYETDMWYGFYDQLMIDIEN